MKRLLALIALLGGSVLALAQATIPVSGQHVTDNVAAPLTGRLLFTVTDTSNTPVTYTPQGGSPTTATIAIPVTNGVVQYVGGFPPQIPNPVTMSPANTRYRIQSQTAGGSTTYFTLPLTNINTSSWSFDSYIVPSTIVITGIARPQLPCQPGAEYNQTDASLPYPWVCSQLHGSGTVVWTQNPTLAPNVCQAGGQAFASPIAAPPYCIDATLAYATPGMIFGIAGSVPGPFTTIPANSGTLTPNAPVTHQFLTGVDGSGNFLRAQPAFSDISGAVLASQLPAFTGDVTSAAGTSVLTLATVNSNVGTCGDATHVGQITLNAKGLATACTAVAITAGGGGFTPAGPVAHQFFTAVNSSGIFTLGQPAFSDISGSPTASQIAGAGTLSNATTGNAGTATQFATAPSQCSTGLVATGITANGTPNCTSSTANVFAATHGIVYNTSTSTSMNATAAQIVAVWSGAGPAPCTGTNVLQANGQCGAPGGGGGLSGQTPNYLPKATSSTTSTTSSIIEDLGTRLNVHGTSIALNGTASISGGANIIYLGNGTAGDLTATVYGGSFVGANLTATAGIQTNPLGLATSGGNFNSAPFVLFGSYWTGSIAGADSWQAVNVMGTGTNPTSTLTFFHVAGSTGLANIVMPSLNVGGSAVCTQATGCPAGGGGSGFPIILGGTSVAAGSTTTAVTGFTVNGVTLNAAGSTSLFLNQAGGYTTPAGGAGTVTSVGLSLPGIFAVSGSPVTTSGVLTGTLATQSANMVWAGPTTGSAAAPTFRTLVAADLPLATTSAFGAVKPDGTTVTISAGVISAVSSGGATIAHTADLIQGDGAGNGVDSGVAVGTCSGCHGFGLPEGTAVGGSAVNDILWANSTLHRLMQNPNNIGALMVPGIGTAGTANDCVKLAANGIDLVDAGAACGSGGGMVYPAAGVAVSTGTAWGSSLTAPSGALVGTTDTQTLTNKTLDGVSPATMAFVDPTSSIQTQLNGKQQALTLTTTGTSGAATLTGGALNIPNYATGGTTVLGPLQVPNLFTAVNPPATLSPFTVQANQTIDGNTKYFSDGTAYQTAGANYVSNGSYIADQTFTCLANPGKCSDTFILNLVTKYVAAINGNGQLPINLSSTLTPLYYSAWDLHHAFASPDGAIFVPQMLYLYCQKYGLASTQCGTAYTASVAAIKSAWAFYPRNGTTHLFTVVSGNEYLMTTGFEEYVRNTGDVANGNVWYAADMADMAAIATAQGDSTNATFFNSEHSTVVTAIRANLINGTTGLLISATGQNSANDDIATSALAVACDLRPSVMAACGVLTSGQKTTIENYFDANSATITNANGAVLQTPQSAWAQFGCIQAGGGTPYTGGGCAGYTGSQYQGGLWFYFNDSFALALGQVNQAKVGTFLNTSLNPTSADTAMEWNDRASTAMPSGSSTNYMASNQWEVAVNNAYPLAQTITTGVGCINKYGALVNSACAIAGGSLIYGTNNITTASTPVIFTGGSTNNQILKLTSSNTSNTALFIGNTSAGSKDWAALVVGSAGGGFGVGSLSFLDVTDSTFPFGITSTGISATNATVTGLTTTGSLVAKGSGSTWASTAFSGAMDTNNSTADGGPWRGYYAANKNMAFNVSNTGVPANCTSVEIIRFVNDMGETGGAVNGAIDRNGILCGWNGLNAVNATLTGAASAATYKTATNCSSSASPAVCAAAPAGSVAVAAGGTTLTVNTTAITASSQILLTFDSSLGTRLGVTCNTTVNQPTVSARTAGTSFVITMGTSVSTNPACISYSVVN